MRVALYLPAGLVAGGILANVGYLVLLALASLAGMLVSWESAGDPRSPIAIAGQGGFTLGLVLVTYLFRRLLDRQSFVSLGFQRRPGWVAEALAGFVLGALLMLLIFVADLALGAYALQGFAWQFKDAPSVLLEIGLSFFGFVVVSFSEELVSRGYLLQNLALAWGTLPATLASSALFAIAHLLNPGASLVSTASLMLAGALLAVGYLVTGRLWLPMGLHLSWNFFQGPVFGFPVSGLETASLILLEPIGPDVFTGGSFGPEASALGITANLIGIGLLWLWWTRRPEHYLPPGQTNPPSESG